MNRNVTWSEVEHAYVTVQTNTSVFLAGQPQCSQCLIRYEDLLQKPVQMLSLVCSLVGLEFQAGMDKPYDSDDAMASFQAASFNATTDPKLFQRKSIDPSHAEKWRKVKLPQPLRAETVTLATEYGYELPSSSVQAYASSE